jgi:1-acyl-sn-glycerol-3-phosphate acyltransferase
MALPRFLDWALFNASSWTAWTTFTLGWGFRSVGREHVPMTGPALIVANHQSFIDPILVGLASPRPLTYLARSNLFKNKLGAAIIRAYGAVPIDRGYGREGLQSVFEALDQGRAVLMFPEGERTHDGTIQELKAGISLIVKKTSAPIIPAALSGPYDAWPRHARWPKWSSLMLPDEGRSISVAFEPPVPDGLYRKLEREAILADLRERISRALARANSIRRIPESSYKTLF